jgi:bifunctional UDP-N-acetylglucosamine pyrophosphorylase/glucosamine-1-phosphate N-acetyltransferase
MMEPVHAVVLAAGKGTRMRSDLPKVLHRVCGQPITQYVLDALHHAGISPPILVVGHGADRVREIVGPQVRYAEQAEPLGTGHAVLQALPLVPDDGHPVLVVYGDTPLLRVQTLQALIDLHRKSGAAATLLSAELDDPTGYGRVIRDRDGRVLRIVEEQECSPEERRVKEINAGTYAFEQRALRDALRALSPNNAKGEYYLTDTIGWILSRGRTVSALAAAATEALGINSRQELAAAEAVMRQRLLASLMDAGVTVMDPATTYIHAGVTVGPDTTVHPQSYLEGATIVGARCTIGPHAHLVDATLEEGVQVVQSTVTQSSVGAGTRIGPYSHLRPGCRVGRGVEIGNFAELKNAAVGNGTKVHHMSYLGDVTVGAGVNIGAGTVVCNFDGKRKHHTIIDDDAFIGSDTMLVAPIHIGRGAVTGAGSVVTKDVPAGGVAVGVPARVIRYVSADPQR